MVTRDAAVLKGTDEIPADSAAREVRTARQAVVRSMARQWMIGSIVFGILTYGSVLRDQADRKSAGVTVWAAARAWLLSLDSGVGYTWMAVAAALLIAMAVGVPRPHQVNAELAVRLEEVDTQLQSGVIAVGTASVVVGWAMCVGAEVGTATVLVHSGTGTGKSVPLPDVGSAYILDLIALVAALAVTFVAASMTHTIDRTRRRLREAYAFIDDSNIDRIDRLLRIWTSCQLDEKLDAPRRRLFWPTAMIASGAASATGSGIIAVVEATRSMGHARWWLIPPLITVTTLVYIRAAAACIGRWHASPRDLMRSGGIAVICVFIAALPATLIGAHARNIREVIELGAVVSLPAVVGASAVWLPTRKTWPWSAPIAAYGLIMAISGSRRSTSEKVPYLDEIRRTARMKAQVASKSRRQFEAARIAADPDQLAGR